jgi:hypothetical protein
MPELEPVDYEPPFDAEQPQPMPAWVEKTLPQLVNRWVSENRGDTLAERAARTGAGVARGLGDVPDILALAVAAVGQKGVELLHDAGLFSPEFAAAVKDWRARVKAEIETDEQEFEKASAGSDLANVGRLGGQVLATSVIPGPTAAQAGNRFGLMMARAAGGRIPAQVYGSITKKIADLPTGPVGKAAAMAGGAPAAVYGSAKAIADLARGPVGKAAAVAGLPRDPELLDRIITDLKQGVVHD